MEFTPSEYSSKYMPQLISIIAMIQEESLREKAHNYPKASMLFSSYCPKAAPGILLLPLSCIHFKRGQSSVTLKSVHLLGYVIVTHQPSITQPTRKRIQE